MPSQCDKCGKIFEYRTHYNNHMNRKKPCTRIITAYQCELCGQIFNHKGHYTRHIRRITPCVSHEEAMIYYREQLFADLKKIDDDKEVIKEKNNKIKELEKHMNTTTINSNNTTIGTVNINVTQINAFGCENTEYLTDADYQHAYDFGLKGLQQLVHKKYLDPRHPENWNVAITNLRGDTCTVASNRGIQTQIKDEVTDLMYRNTNIDLEEYEGNKEINRPEEHEIDQALFNEDNKDINRKYTKIRRQTEVKIYNQKAERQYISDKFEGLLEQLPSNSFT